MYSGEWSQYQHNCYDHGGRYRYWGRSQLARVHAMMRRALKALFILAVLAAAVPSYSQLSMTDIGSFGGGSAPPAVPGGSCVNSLPTVQACADNQPINPAPFLF